MSESTVKRLKGRPVGTRKYRSAVALQAAVDDYFESEEIWDVAGLAYHLGFLCRETLLNYEKYDEKYRVVLRRAKLRIEAQVCRRLITESKVAGIIFNLKNNYGYKDSREVDTKISGGADAEPVKIVMFAKPNNAKTRE